MGGHALCIRAMVAMVGKGRTICLFTNDYLIGKFISKGICLRVATTNLKLVAEPLTGPVADLLFRD